jgi:hypothetical protein
MHVFSFEILRHVDILCTWQSYFNSIKRNGEILIKFKSIGYSFDTILYYSIHSELQ